MPRVERIEDLTFTIPHRPARSRYRNAVPCWQVLAESHPFEPVLRGFFDLILVPSAYQVVTAPSLVVVIVTLQAPPSNWAFFPCRKLAEPMVEKRSRASRASIF